MHSWSGAEEAPGVVRCHERGLEAVRATNAHGSLLVLRHGAQILDYRPEGQAPVLWVSRMSRFESGAAVRGGVPICFPWFGAHPSEPRLPAHGFARTRAFLYVGSRAERGATTLSFELAADEATRALWPFDFVARLHATLGSGLGIDFEVENTGARELDFSEALHTYFAVADVRRIGIEGLENASYEDKVSGAHVVERESRVSIGAETDRVYHSAATCVLDDPLLGRRLSVEKTGSATTVVWNPWSEKARRMSDFGDDEYTSMVCIESANTGDARVRLGPGQRHRLSVVITRR